MAKQIWKVTYTETDYTGQFGGGRQSRTDLYEKKEKAFDEARKHMEAVLKEGEVEERIGWLEEEGRDYHESLLENIKKDKIKAAIDDFNEVMTLTEHPSEYNLTVEADRIR